MCWANTELVHKGNMIRRLWSSGGSNRILTELFVRLPGSLLVQGSLLVHLLCCVGVWTSSCTMPISFPALHCTGPLKWLLCSAGARCQCHSQSPHCPRALNQFPYSLGLRPVPQQQCFSLHHARVLNWLWWNPRAWTKNQLIFSLSPGIPPKLVQDSTWYYDL